MKLSNIKKLSIILSLAIIISIVLGVSSPIKSYAKDNSQDIEKVLEQTMAYMLENKEGFLDAWPIIGLARHKATDIDKMAEIYLNNLKKELNEKEGILTTNKYTEYSKTILALTAIGIDPKDIGGYNLFDSISDMDKLTIQGINGPIWALIALDSNNYSSSLSRDTLINYMLENEIQGGGWSLSSETPDVDITGMVLTSLSKYKDRVDIKPYIERGLDFISSAQDTDGGFDSMSAANAESNAQVIVALTSLGIDPLNDARFIKNGNNVMDNLIANYYDNTGGFAHIKNTKIDKIATEQAFYALVSYIRFKEQKTPLFDMSDISTSVDNNNKTNTETTINPFQDIEKDSEKIAIIELNKDGIIEGITQTEFRPNKNITRAEFATLITRALGKQETHDHGFIDVNKSEWFSGYVGGAKELGLINGYPDNTFKPQNNITRQEAAMIIYNTAKFKGLDTTMSEAETRNNLSQFPDYINIGHWSKEAMAFGVKKGYIPNNIINIEPTRAATRSEVAGMLYRLLD